MIFNALARATINFFLKGRIFKFFKLTVTNVNAWKRVGKLTVMYLLY